MIDMSYKILLHNIVKVRTKEIFFLIAILFFIILIFYQTSCEEKDSDRTLFGVSSYQKEGILHESVNTIFYSNGVILELGTLKNMIGGDIELYSDSYGNRIVVAVLDTGIYPHYELGVPNNRIIHSVDLVHGIEKPYDDNGHGTAIAGIISSVGSETGLIKDSFIDLISVKVLDYRCKGYINSITEGIEWVIENKDKYDIRIINLSIGVPYEGESDTIIEAVRKANENGILVVTSAGNKKGGINIYSPAVEESCIAVGSIYDTEPSQTHDYSIASYTNRWQEDGKEYPLIYAPGSNIETLKSNIYYKGSDQEKREPEYCTATGTSVSAAIVTGVAAYYMLEYPEMNVNEIREVIFKRSLRIFDKELNLNFTYVYIGEKKYE